MPLPEIAFCIRALLEFEVCVNGLPNSTSACRCTGGLIQRRVHVTATPARGSGRSRGGLLVACKKAWKIRILRSNDSGAATAPVQVAGCECSALGVSMWSMAALGDPVDILGNPKKRRAPAFLRERVGTGEWQLVAVNPLQDIDLVEAVGEVGAAAQRVQAEGRDCNDHVGARPAQEHWPAGVARAGAAAPVAVALRLQVEAVGKRASEVNQRGLRHEADTKRDVRDRGMLLHGQVSPYPLTVKIVSFLPRALSSPLSTPACGSWPYSGSVIGWSRITSPTSRVFGNPAKLAKP